MAVGLAVFFQVESEPPKAEPAYQLYFGIVENDASHPSGGGMNEAQTEWWKKNADKYPGIHYVSATDGDPDVPKGATYFGIVWGEHFTRDEGYVASGEIFVWVQPEGRFHPGGSPLYGSDHVFALDDSVSLLKDGLDYMQTWEETGQALSAPPDGSGQTQ